LILAIVLLFVACPEQPKDVLVKVDGSVFTKEDLERYVPTSEFARLTDEQIKEVLQNWADQEIIYLEAKKLGIDKEDSIRLVLDEYEKNLLSMSLVRRSFGGNGVTEAEIRTYFENHKDEFLYAVKVGQIVLPNLESAQMTLEEIKAGADFYKLAKERSLTRMENPDNPRVITEYLPRGTIADFGIEEVIFNMKPDELSDVIPYIQGTYLIVKMIDKRKMKAKAELTNEIKNLIYNYMLQKKYQEFLINYVDSLKTHYTVTYDLTPLRQ
jgi:hypothetical protein